MDREVLVYVDLDGAPYLAGRLWTRLRKNKEIVPGLFGFIPGLP